MVCNCESNVLDCIAKKTVQGFLWQTVGHTCSTDRPCPQASPFPAEVVVHLFCARCRQQFCVGSAEKLGKKWCVARLQFEQHRWQQQGQQQFSRYRWEQQRGDAHLPAKLRGNHESFRVDRDEPFHEQDSESLPRRQRIHRLTY